MDLYRLAYHCSHGALYDELIHDRIVVDLWSAALSQKLQRDVDLMLEKAVQMVSEDKTIRKQQARLREASQRPSLNWTMWSGKLQAQRETTKCNSTWPTTEAGEVHKAWERKHLPTGKNNATLESKSTMPVAIRDI